MSDPSEVTISGSPPPPAYEISEREFDRKTAVALQTSRADYQATFPTRPSGGQDDASLDESAAESDVLETTSVVDSVSESELGSGSGYGVGSYSQYRWTSSGKDKEAEASGSSAKADEVLSQRKEKAQASWFTDLRRGDSIGGASLTRSGTMSTYCERQATPPPMFEAMGPSLDGPPYELPAAQITLTYRPGDSRPCSPLTTRSHSRSSSFAHPHPLPPIPHQPKGRQRPPLPSPPQLRQPRNIASPSPPRTNLAPSTVSSPQRRSPIPGSNLVRGTPSPRPVSIFNPTSTRVTFDPQFAYNSKPSLDLEDGRALAPTDASSFYKSVNDFVLFFYQLRMPSSCAVSSHVSSSIPSSQKPQPRRL